MAGFSVGGDQVIEEAADLAVLVLGPEKATGVGVLLTSADPGGLEW